MIEQKSQIKTIRSEIPQDLSLSKQAAGYFIRASLEFPTSVVTQGARIAQLCKESKSDPSKLQSALLQDKERIKAIHKAAQAMHKKHQKNLELEEEKVRRIIVADFMYASDMMILNREELVEITDDIYPFYLRSQYFRTIDAREDVIRDIVQKKLLKKRTSRL